MTIAQGRLIYPRKDTSGPHRTVVVSQPGTPRLWGAFALAIFVLSALAAHAQPSDSRADIAGLLQAVQAGNEQLGQAARTGAALAGTNLAQVAGDRKTAMLSLMEQAPALALQNAFAPAALAQLPADIRTDVEAPVSRDGTLEVLGVLFDQDSGRSGVQLNLYSGNGVARLFVDTIPDNYVTGARVVANGFKLEDRIVASHDNITIAGVNAVPPAGSATDVPRTALVININFSDNPAEPYSQDFAQNTVYNGQVTPWFADVSYGQLAFSADVTPWYTIDASSSTCATNTFRDQAVAAATADGYKPSQYNHIVMSFPRVAACGFAGLAQVGQVGGNGPYYAWLNNAMNLRVSVHELGHNLGLLHSHSLLCYDAPLSSDVSTCSKSEYGDVFDVMGSSSAAYHGAYKNYLRWIPDTDVVSLDGQSDQVTLSSVETLSGPRVLRIARPDTSPQEYFFVDVREPVGVDQTLSQYPYLTTGVPVYLGSLRDQSIIRMQQTTSAEAPLQVGDTFYDPNSTLTIMVVSVGGGQATIAVNY